MVRCVCRGDHQDGADATKISGLVRPFPMRDRIGEAEVV